MNGLRFLWGPPKGNLEKASITFLVTPSWGGRTLQFAVPLRVVRFTLIIALLLALAVLMAAFGFGRVAIEARSAARISAQNDSLRSQFSRLEALDRELKDLSAVDVKLRKIAGLDAYDGPADPAGAAPQGAVATMGEQPIHHAGKAWTFTAPDQVPSRGPISQGFHEAGIGDGLHPGVDIPGPTNSPICAAGNGIVSKVGVDSVYGNMVIINHSNGIESLYGHASRVLVALGDTVWAGQEIAAVGNTGRSSAPHLHFAILRHGQPVDPSIFVSGLGK